MWSEIIFLGFFKYTEFPKPGKSIVKNPLFYIENSAFNVENLGYSKDRPGLTPTEIKGKLKGSGYGESSKSKPKQGEPGTGFIPVKESKISYKDLLNS